MGGTDKGEIAEGFCRFFSEVGPSLAAKVGREREGAFLEYMGARVEEEVFLRPTTPGEVEDLCKSLVPFKGMGWDEVSPGVIKSVASEISAPLSRLLTAALEGGIIPPFLRWQGWSQYSRGRIPLSLPITGLSQFCLFSRRSLRGC